MMRAPYHLKHKSRTSETPRTGTRNPLTPVDHPEKARTNTDCTRHCNVHTKKCWDYQMHWRQNNLVTQIKETNGGHPPPPPPQTESEPPTRQNNHNKEDVTEYPQQLSHDLNVSKGIIQHDKHNDYIPLMSAIDLKKKRMMLFIPLEFEKIKIDALVDSRAYINFISGRDA